MAKLFRLLRYDWPLHVVLVLTNWLPDNTVFLRFRGFLVQPFFGKCGDNFRLGRNITFYNPSQIFIGKDVYFASGCWVMAGDKIKIEDEVMFGPFCVVVSSKHQRKGQSFRYGMPLHKPIFIDSGTWVAAHVIISAGSNIGKGCLVAAGAVVNGNFPDGSMVGGVPAHVIKTLESELA